ncbi:MAG TPA: mechanosensitive ion channel domain-containing protein [Acidisoma sp.]|uniref:mechanosensitive ion channel domain-containing protein n=1 Tax=Acidisoma sp. TaxID=1872115 RepID=UPI002BDB3E6A|nr:mechanosensitive ion channel domain-containing protein [Acidisoma sp.]HTI01675.1 mechanosensitive ion channel domain-containing protein [Acidisoma sp.]
MRPRFATILLLLPLLLISWAAHPPDARAAAAATASGPAAPAADATASGLTTAETQQLLSVLQNPQKREQFVTTLKNLEKASATTGTTAAPSAAPAATAPAAAAPAAAAKTAVTLEPHSLGADLLSQADTVLAQVAADLSRAGASMFDFHDLRKWFSTLVQNSTAAGIILAAIWRLAVIMLAGLICEYFVRLGTRRLYDRLGRESGTAEAHARLAVADSNRAVAEAEAHREAQEEAEGTAEESLAVLGEQERLEPPDPDAPVTLAAAAPEPEPEPGLPVGTEPAEDEVRHRPSRPLHSGWPLLRRLPFILLAMIVDAIPILAFMVAATALLATPLVSDILIRLTIAAVINAYALVRLLLVVARGTVCAPTAKLRLLHISNEAAAFLATWSRRIGLVILVGFSVVQIGTIAGMTFGLQNGISRIFSLIVHLMLVIMVLKRRREVAAWLSQPDDRGGTWHRLKLRLSHVWHWQATILIVLVWLLFATEVTNHVQHPTRLILFTLGLLVLFRVLHIVLLGALEKAFTIGGADTSGRYAMITARATRYHAPLRYLLNVAVVLGLVLSLLRLWDLRAFSWLSVGDLGSRLLSSLGTIGITLVLAIVIWETLNFFIQVYLDELSQQGMVIRAARLRTILPLLRNTLLIALLAIFVLTALSEIGVNIGPLLAGASIIGVALGFGSQKLVQDFINGIFLLLENAMQVGDWVTAAGLSGTVENLSIRTLRLRASDGSVHIIPFSSVTTVTNVNKGRGNATLSVTVSYEEDTDRVADLLKQIVVDMRAEDAYRDGMLSDFGYWGVDSIDGRAATLMGQVACTDKMRWGVQRELNRRIKIAFQKEGIVLMPNGTVMALQHPLDVKVELPERAARTSRLDDQSGS